MPRKPKKPTAKIQKQKNIIQNVIVKVGTEEKQKRKRKPRKKAAPKSEGVSIYQNIPPVVIQQPSPQMNISPPPPPHVPHTIAQNLAIPEVFKPQPSPVLIETIKKETKPEFISLVEAFPTESEKRPVKLQIKEKQKTESILGIGRDEFAPTATFTSEDDKIQSQKTNDKLYTEEPVSFKSQVLGNTQFGEEIQPIKTKKIMVESEEDDEEETTPKEKKTRPRIYKQMMELFNLDESHAKERYENSIQEQILKGKTRKQALAIVNATFKEAAKNPEEARVRFESRPRSRLRLIKPQEIQQAEKVVSKTA